MTVPGPVREVPPVALHAGRTSATRSGLAIVVSNPAGVGQLAVLTATERLGGRRFTYKAVAHAIRAHGSVTFRLTAPAGLRRALAAALRRARRVKRRPVVSLRSVGPTQTLRPTLTIRR